ncbi:TSUP family transporter [Shinella sp. 838]|jgi:uncharacterized membrane protein YfcA|uniref:TSUP family transporter n=1 Tax=unclassified Shinella TaxID=2643062 RepID=UPI0003C56BC5|nr:MULTISPECIES: TSUP family transporter [unclassified Shinella]MCA0342124.1 TSUP family transporter [Pseudomonadota bacterium]MDG4669567.1 TSUP family transporter [Shinella sp. 838]
MALGIFATLPAGCKSILAAEVTMILTDFLLLAGAGLIGGLCNAIAGGGTFFTLPALIAVGVPPVSAAATSAVAIWPGHALAVVGAPERLPAEESDSMPWVAGGALAGAALLLLGGNDVFRVLVPWLILTATLLFTFAAPLHRLVGRLAGGKGPRCRFLDFAAALYGGYFGAGLGVVLMALIMLEGEAALRRANLRKNFRAAVVTSLAAAVFIASGSIAWRQGLPVFAGALAGGFLGGRLAAHVPAIALRLAVIATGIVLFLSYL